MNNAWTAQVTTSDSLVVIKVNASDIKDTPRCGACWAPIARDPVYQARWRCPVCDAAGPYMSP